MITKCFSGRVRILQQLRCGCGQVKARTQPAPVHGRGVATPALTHTTSSITLRHCKLVVTNALRLRIMRQLVVMWPHLKQDEVPMYMLCSLTGLWHMPGIPSDSDVARVHHYISTQLVSRLGEVGAVLLEKFVLYFRSSHTGGTRSQHVVPLFTMLQGHASLLLEQSGDVVERVYLCKALAHIMFYLFYEKPLDQYQQLITKELHQHGPVLMRAPALVDKVARVLVCAKNPSESGLVRDFAQLLQHATFTPHTLHSARATLINLTSMGPTRETISDTQLTDRLYHIVITALNTHFGLERGDVVVAAGYILHFCPHKRLPSVVMERMAAFAPNLTINNIRFLSGQINHKFHSCGPQMKQQLVELQYLLIESLMAQTGSLTASTTIHHYNTMVDTLMREMNNIDISLLEKLLSRFQMFSGQMTSNIVVSILRYVRQRRFYAGALLEQVGVHVLGDALCPGKVATSFASTCYLLGHTPPAHTLPDLLPHTRHAMDRDNICPTYLVNLAIAFSFFQYLPQEFVSDLINPTFLALMDKKIQELPPASGGKVREKLMQLNRCLTLDWPQYNVPWFHESFCERKFSAERVVVSGVQRDVQQTLCSILGGDSFHGAGLYSPYYHFIDLVCLLDDHDNPLLFEKHKHLLSSKDADINKVAILLIHSFDHSSNDIHHLNGYTQSKLTHLEMFGYRLALVYQQEWTSMYLSESEAKQQYLFDKIFNTHKQHKSKRKKQITGIINK